MQRLLVIQHVEREAPQMYSTIANHLGLDVIKIRLYLGDPLPVPGSKDLLLILGGPMGISDLDKSQYPWLRKELELIKYVLKKRIPIIGVCLGAQLLAYAAGGNVVPMIDKHTSKPTAEIGWGRVMFHKNSSNYIFNKYLNKDFHMLHWHGDRIILPKSALLLASSDKCREQMFQIGSNAYGIQFHSEVEEDSVRKWISEDIDFVYKFLGNQGKHILENQLRLYCDVSKVYRTEFITDVLESLI